MSNNCCCLVCGDLAAVEDENGRVISSRNETPSSSNKFSSHHHRRQLFHYFCQSLSMSREKKGTWNFEKEPFPFCEACQLILNSLAEVYSELEELQKVLKQKLMDGERKYSEQKLYSRHDDCYLQFRKEALGDKFLGDEKHEQSSDLPNDACSDYDPGEVDEEEVVLLSFDLDVPDEDETPEVAPPSISSLQPVTEEHQIFEIATMSPEEPSPDDILLVLEPDGSSNQDDSPQASEAFQVQPKRKKKASLKSSVRKSSKAKVNEKDTPNSKLPYLKDATDSNGVNGVKTDTKNGTVSYTTSYGDSKTPTTLVFKEVTDKDENLIGYQCQLCSEEVPSSNRSPFTKKRNNEQRSFFYQHYLRFHTRRYKCLLCSALNNIPSGRTELLEHLKGTHDIPDLESYDKLHETNKIIKRYGKVRGRCEICYMPFADTRKKEYRDHRWTHLSSEEKQAALARPPKLGKRRWDDMEPPSQELISSGIVIQCQTCGVFIKGRHAFKKHELAHLVQKGDPPFMCSICGRGFSIKQTLDQHEEKAHRDRTFSCGYHDCNEQFGRDSELESHVGSDHAQSEEASERRMCLLCARVSVSPWHSKRHTEVVHSTERRHQCHICQKKLSDKGTLTKHLTAIHREGAKEWVCSEGECGLRFHCSTHYHNHMRTQHGVFVKGSKAKKRQPVETP